MSLAIRILKWVGINVLLIAAALAFYIYFTHHIEQATESEGYLSMLAIVLSMVFMLMFMMYPERRKWLPGVWAVSLSLITFTILKVNFIGASVGEYESRKFHINFPNDGQVYFSFSLWRFGYTSKGDLNYNIGVDSIDIRIDKGLLGLEVYREVFKITESKSCDKIYEYGMSELDLANAYKFHRCFDEALDLYEQVLDTGRGTYLAYKNRAEIYVYRGEWEKALLNYYEADNFTEKRKESALNSLTNLLEKRKATLTQKDWKAIKNAISKINVFDRTMVNYCYEQLEREKRVQ